MLDRVPLLFNADVALSLVQAAASRTPFFYRNAQGDEVVFVVEGDGVLESSFGELPFRAGDYVVIPRGILHRCALGKGPLRFLVIESPATCARRSATATSTASSPRWRPFCERDIRRPSDLQPHDETRRLPRGGQERQPR